MKPTRTPADVVHRENKWSLLRYRGPRRHPTPVLLVPSLINRHYILDLMPGKSLVEYLVGRGLDVYCIDWGTPGDEDRYLTFDDVADGYLGRAIRVAGGRPHVLGYCLGGTLAAIHVAAHPERAASLVALAAPVRFHDDGLLSAWTRARTFDVDALVGAWGNVPWPLMQSAFHLLRPTLALAKLVALVDKGGNEEFRNGFFALEGWGNDNVSFPGACYARYVKELYREDALAKGTFTLSGRPARLDAIRCPTLAVTFEHDNIVPWRSAAALLELVGSADKQHLHLPGGHVGAVVARSAAQGLWPKLADFWLPRRPQPREAQGGAVSKAAPSLS